jgi:hypothetical protein
MHRAHRPPADYTAITDIVLRKTEATKHHLPARPTVVALLENLQQGLHGWSAGLASFDRGALVLKDATAEISPVATHTPLAMVTTEARTMTTMRIVAIVYAPFSRLIA